MWIPLRTSGGGRVGGGLDTVMESVVAAVHHADYRLGGDVSIIF
jgi:hypothetical protein